MIRTSQLIGKEDALTMKNGNSLQSLRDHLLYLLTDGGAHLTFDAAAKDLPAALHGKRPKGAEHSPWELLEHMRIAQDGTGGQRIYRSVRQNSPRRWTNRLA